MRFANQGSRISAATLGALAVCLVCFAASAGAQTGGAGAPGDPAAPAPTGPPGKATLLSNGQALAPANAPPQVVAAIAAANSIATYPYIWGGGHRSFFSNGYDCSGAVSYMLHGGGLLPSPLPSGPLMKYGVPGHGTWITVFSNPSHAYAVVAGLRWDTSAVGEKLNSGSGPRWRASKRRSAGYVMRHYPGL
ncbi:MAG: hypothetical protein QOD60_2540 [Solirubrobacterales bacterium]|nr:hypothetical protein [Solirubrobacterales bacterium]